MSGGH